MQAIVVIPTYDERASLGQVVNNIHQCAKDLHILIVDDNSPDGTGEIAEDLSRKNPGKLFVLHREKQKRTRKSLCGRVYPHIKEEL